MIRKRSTQQVLLVLFVEGGYDRVNFDALELNGTAFEDAVLEFRLGRHCQATIIALADSE
jgi:hypothetical protein